MCGAATDISTPSASSAKHILCQAHICIKRLRAKTRLRCGEEHALGLPDCRALHRRTRAQLHDILLRGMWGTGWRSQGASVWIACTREGGLHCMQPVSDARATASDHTHRRQPTSPLPPLPAHPYTPKHAQSQPHLRDAHVTRAGLQLLRHQRPSGRQEHHLTAREPAAWCVCVGGGVDKQQQFGVGGGFVRQPEKTNEAPVKIDMMRSPYAPCFPCGSQP